MTNSSDLKRLHALYPLNWTSTESRTKNTSFNLSATDDFRSFQNRIILQYHIYVIYPETDSTAEPEYQLMINGTNTHLVQPCTSVDGLQSTMRDLACQILERPAEQHPVQHVRRLIKRGYLRASSFFSSMTAVREI